MSKALGTIGKIAGVVGAVAFAAGTLGVGGPATAALLTQIGTYAGIASAVATLGAQLTAKKPPIQGSLTDITIGADQPTPYMIGDTYTGGALVKRSCAPQSAFPRFCRVIERTLAWGRHPAFASVPT